MTHADFRLARAMRALSESNGAHRDWLESADLYMFCRLLITDVPPPVWNEFLEFKGEVAKLQSKYGYQPTLIPAALFTDAEVVRVTKIFSDLAAAWPSSGDLNTNPLLRLHVPHQDPKIPKTQ